MIILPTKRLPRLPGIRLPFKNTQTQGNLVKELHLSCYSGPRFRAFQISMRRMSEEGISFKSF